MQLTKDFSEQELNCRCGVCACRINLFFATKLQLLRDRCRFSLPISSGARCEKHNAEVGGAPDSRHLYGEAVDISWVGLTGQQKMELLSNTYTLGFGGVGLGENLLHLDTRPGDVVVWVYKGK